MMLFKLSARNLRKSMRDYMIYFATLILGVAIFYVFNALGSQTIMMKVSKNTADIIRLMNSTLSVVSVFVSFVLGFLIVYASNFLMKRRKKEFGIYMLLGMGKRDISLIILFETVLIGMISLAAGLMLGIAASQGMSILVANMFEADMTKFRFIVSVSSILKTIAYFIVMYIVVLVMDTIVVGKAKLINLIHAGRKSEKNVAKKSGDLSDCVCCGSSGTWERILLCDCRDERIDGDIRHCKTDCKRNCGNVYDLLVIVVINFMAFKEI